MNILFVLQRHPNAVEYFSLPPDNGMVPLLRAAAHRGVWLDKTPQEGEDEDAMVLFSYFTDGKKDGPIYDFRLDVQPEGFGGFSAHIQGPFSEILVLGMGC